MSDANISTANDQEKRPWYKSKKLDQWLCFWTVPIFYNAFGLVFINVTWIMPPRSPTGSVEGIVEFMQSPNMLVALSLYMLFSGLAATAFCSIYMILLKRMSVSPAFRYLYLVGQTVAAIISALLPIVCFSLGAFRPGYDPEILVMLYDFGYLTWIATLGVFYLGYLMLALAILLDKNQIFPKWIGYWTVWEYVAILMAIPAWITKTGPFAWDGLLSFWFGVVLFVPWLFTIITYIYKAIKKQPEDELDNVRFARTAGA